ncbi:putative membrane protein [Rhizobium aquaticum]|uniref:Membrane protein n=1 Tax=Rhizobium aquaticum TaxID=1549636 RepID=A0ABV2IXF7_9HYPH
MYEVIALVLALVAVILLRRAETRISKLENRVKDLEARPIGIAAAAVATEAPGLVETHETASAPPVVDVEPTEMLEPTEPVEMAVHVSKDMLPEPAVSEPSPQKPQQSLESMIGARWPVWVGGLALALGGIFMVKYSIEQGLVSPAVRLTMASLFGLVLLALGEWVRRRQSPLDLPALKHALVPGALTAAGSVTLFGAIYAAYGFYDYLGPTPAFALLAIVALVTVGLSLLHGQALAGLGLLAAMITPALVGSDDPSAWGLFTYLTIAWFATMAAARIRRWNAVPALANTMMMLWYLVFMAHVPPFGVWAMVLSVAAMMAGLALLWPAGDGEAEEIEVPVEVSDEADGTQKPRPSAFRIWRSEALPHVPHRWVRVTGVLAALAAGAGLVVFGGLDGISTMEMIEFGVLCTAIAAVGAWRSSGFLFALGGLVAALLGSLNAATGDAFSGMGLLASGEMPPVAVLGDSLVGPLLGIGLGFAALGVLALHRHARSAPAYAVLWSWLMLIVPLTLAMLSFLEFGNFTLDLKHGGVGIGYAVLFLAIAQWIEKRMDAPRWRDAVIGALVTGSYLSVVLALHALAHTVVTTILVAVAGFAYLYASRIKPWPALTWMMGLAGVVVLARIAWQPSLVGDMTLSKTPFFNQLLPGYGIPAILAGLGAYMIKDGPSIRARNFLQALASLLGLMTVAILTRHALNGGSLAGNEPTLSEQAIYTLIAVGGSAVLMTLDMKSPSPVFRWGSMIVGTISLLSALFAHLITLNPYFTGELTGEWPFFNLLLLGYLLPALGYFGLAYYARGKRPEPYVYGLATGGAVMAFAWVTLSVRRFWQGPGLADWKGFDQAEMYTYSVVWLILGVGLLVAGSRFQAKSLRLASAVLVFASVLKVFLIDMSNLEGIFRAASFIGLGAVLIGIGLFYQKVLRTIEKPAAGNGLSDEAPGDTSS